MVPITLRVFLSSPSDVGDERGLVKQIIDKLSYESEFLLNLNIELIAWDQKNSSTPLLATMSPQEAINAGLPKPEDCDVVVVIFWARMGLNLDTENFKKPDGTPFISGTEWEYWNAVQAHLRWRTPEILVYRRSEKPMFYPLDPNFDEDVDQFRAVENFFAQNFYNPDGSAKGGFNVYETPADFANLLENHLRRLFLQAIQKHTLELRAVDINSSSQEAQPLWKGSPFPGLRKFETEDAPIYFGRGIDIDNLIRRFKKHEMRLIAIVGASGSGKSSLVAAGLIPRLMNGAIEGSQDWIYIRFSPGELTSGNPFEALAVALIRELSYFRRAKIDVIELTSLMKDNSSYLKTNLDKALKGLPKWTKVVFFIDQFEELLTLTQEIYLLRFLSFLKNGLENDSLRFILTLRADFYPRCLEYAQLAELFKETTYPLSSPSQAELEEMITQPAARAGLQFEQGLVRKILQDAGEDAGSLALMAFALQQLYEARDDERSLTFSAYTSFGGVQGAIGERAEQTFNELVSKWDQNVIDVKGILQKLFSELVAVDARGVFTRKPALFDLISIDNTSKELIEGFTQARLLIQSKDKDGNSIVSVAHEALLREWKSLADWLQDEHEFLKFKYRLTNDVEEWKRVPEAARVGLLYRENRLEVAIAWTTSRPNAFTKDQHRFVRDSRQDKHKREQEQLELIEALNKRNMQLQAVIGVSEQINRILDSVTKNGTFIHFYQDIVNIIREKFGFYYVGLFIVDRKRKNANLQAGTGREGNLMVQNDYRLALTEKSMIGWSILHNEIRVANDVGEDVVHFNNPYLPSTRSEMALPLYIRDKVIGALTLQSEQLAYFDKDKGHDVQEILGSMARQIALALENGDLLSGLEENRRQLNVIGKSAKLATELFDIVDLIHRIAVLIKETFYFDYVGIFMVEMEKAVLRGGTDAPGKEMIAASYSLAMSENSMIAWCIKHKTPRIANATEDDEFWRPNTYLPNTKTEVAVPLIFRDQAIGAITIQQNQTNAFDREHLPAIQSMADQLAIAIGKFKSK